MNKETDKKKKKPFIKGPGGYLVAAATGFITLAWVGLILAPFVLLVLNAIFSNESTLLKWFFWSLLGLFCLSTLESISDLSLMEPTHRASVIKGELFNGMQECIVRGANNQSTNFSDVPSFKRKFPLHEIKQSSDPDLKNTCYGARAIPKDLKEQKTCNKSRFNWFSYDPIRYSNYTTCQTWFEINHKDGVAIKNCGDSTKPGCKEGNKW